MNSMCRRVHCDAMICEGRQETRLVDVGVSGTQIMVHEDENTKKSKICSSVAVLVVHLPPTGGSHHLEQCRRDFTEADCLGNLYGLWLILIRRRELNSPISFSKLFIPDETCHFFILEIKESHELLPLNCNISSLDHSEHKSSNGLVEVLDGGDTVLVRLLTSPELKILSAFKQFQQIHEFWYRFLVLKFARNKVLRTQEIRRRQRRERQHENLRNHTRVVQLGIKLVQLQQRQIRIRIIRSNRHLMLDILLQLRNDRRIVPLTLQKSLNLILQDRTHGCILFQHQF
mmetsp:Transcript_45448/g.176740  ORF Transcript_45448/g.176740 Transcript_45448/m.176740 type:complete len:287 (-) Transcript_45448:120-980(-)